ncbi:MAG: hypothetical protein ACKOFF_00160 [Acidimicrobiales bacterium]
MFLDAGAPQWWGRWMEARPLRTGRGLPWSLRPRESLFAGDTAAREVIDHKGIGYGAINTRLIIAQNGEGRYAAAHVAAQTIGGRNDWFLPSKDELNALYDRFALHGRPFMEKAPYWSSSENGANYSWYQLFQDGTQFTDENGLGNVTANKDLRRMPRHSGSGFPSLQFRLVAVRAFGPVSGGQPAVSSPVLTGNTCDDDGPCSVGDTGPGGGIVFYDAGRHEPWGRWLEMAPVETEFVGVPWKKLSVKDRQRPLYRDDAGGLARHKRVLSKRIGTGQTNTKRIVRDYGPGNYAAWAAWALVHGGKSDWFLPSQYELAEAHRNLFSAVPSLNTIRRSFYWSSSEYNYDTAWTVNMKDGQQFDREKWTVPNSPTGKKAIRTRAVRAFG